MDLTQGKESSLILRFATPMLIGSIFQQSYLMVDSAIVGKVLGDAALGAIGASFPIIFALISFIIGVASGSTIIISQFFGAKQIENVQKTIDTMWVFLFFASIVITGIGWIFGGSIFKMIELPEEIVPLANEYLTIYLSGMILFFGYNGTSAILRGLGDSMTPLIFLIISTVVNIILDIVFIKYMGMGIAGAAYATIIAQGGAFVTAIIYLNRKHEIIQFKLNIQFDKEIFKKSIKIGLPSGIQTTLVSVGMVALFRIVNEFGTEVVAAYSVAGRVDAFAAMPAMMFAQALSTFVGQNLGANKPDRVKKGFEATLLISSIIAVIVMVVVYFFGEDIMRIFTDSEVVAAYGKDYLVIVSSFYLLFTVLFASNGVMRGAGDTVIPMLVTLLALWVVRIPASWLLSRGELGVNGIWWGIPAAWAIGALFSYTYYRTGRWKSKVVVKHDDPA